jgi:hypothetical protein
LPPDAAAPSKEPAVASGQAKASALATLSNKEKKRV